MWPAIKNIIEFMDEIVDVLIDGSFQKITSRADFVLSYGNAHLPDGLKIVYAMVALLAEGMYDVIVPAPNRDLDEKISDH